MLSETPSALYGAKYCTFSNGVGGHAALLVQRAVVVVELARLIEEAEVGALHVEAHRGDRALLLREVREDRLRAATRPRSSSSRARTRR